MIEDVVVDTNVAVVANYQTEQASEMCIESCIDALQSFRNEACFLLDDRRLDPRGISKALEVLGSAGSGRRFFQVVMGQPGKRSALPEGSDNAPRRPWFRRVPGRPNLAQFDRDDRMFVAVALASGTHPTVMNASDRDWWIYRKALKRCGVAVTFLCPELMTGG